MRPRRKSPEYVAIRRIAAAWLIDAPTGGPRPEIRLDLTPRLLRRAWQMRRDIECVACHDLVMRLAAVQSPGLDDYHERVATLSAATRWRLIAIYQGLRQQGKISGKPIRLHAAEKREMLINAFEWDRYTQSGRDCLGSIFDAARERQAQAAAGASPLPEERHEEEFAGMLTHVIHIAEGLKPSTYGGKTAERDNFRISIAKPLKIGGPQNEHAVDELFAGLYAETPWMQEPIEFMWRSARENAGDLLGFRLPPVLLVGPPGCGKTHLARRIGELSGCAPLTIDMTAASSTGIIAGLEFSWGTSHPGGPLRHVESKRLANPIIILDEIEKRSHYSNGGDPVAALLPMLQPETAREIYNPWLQSTVDMSRISWILLANQARRLPTPLLDRVRVFQVELPRGQDLRLLVRKAIGDLAEPEIIEIAASEIEHGRMSMRGLQRVRHDIERAARRPLLH